MDQTLIEGIVASLKELAAKGGQSALLDERRVRGKLADSYPEEGAARNIVVEALKSGLPGRLSEADPALIASTLNRESEKLRRQLGADSAIARGAVTAWALTLGLPVTAADATPPPESAPGEQMIRCDQGHVFAQALGRCPVCGWEVKADKARVAPWLQSLVFSDQVSSPTTPFKPKPMAIAAAAATLAVAAIVLVVLERPKSDEITAAAKRGDPAAENALGLKYASGVEGVPQDDVKAVEWFQKAAEQGFAKAETNLGDMYLYGRGGLAKDVAKAQSWYEKAALQAFPDAQYRLGVMYENGIGVTKDTQRAVTLYRSAASGGYPDAENLVGVLFATGGFGLPHDDDQAVSWYRKSADQGFAKAEMNLGDMYFFGRSVAKDYQQAASWYRKAADQHLAAAEMRLGVMYEKGLGVDPNSQNALNYYQSAARDGDPDAQNAYDRLSAKMRNN
jgi:TPR repeat protein